jgi:nucleoid DNA-binding protein
MGCSMNKLELINNLKEECQISKNESAGIVDLFFDKISAALAEGDRVEIRGLDEPGSDHGEHLVIKDLGQK